MSANLTTVNFFFIDLFQTAVARAQSFQKILAAGTAELLSFMDLDCLAAVQHLALEYYRDFDCKCNNG
jgi:hypothetical protein